MTSLAVRLMLRAFAVALAGWLLAAVWGFVQLHEDVHGELEAAMALARTLDRVLQSPHGNEPWPGEVVALRHLAVTVRDADGRLLFQRPAPAAPHDPDWLSLGVDALARWLPDPALTPYLRTLSHPEGERTLVLAPDADSERREALAGLARNLGVMGLAVVLMLVIVAFTLRQALWPLHRLAQAISGIRPGATALAHATVQRLDQEAGKGVREVQEVSAALQALAQALDKAEADRRVLAQRLISAQEAERARLARELHDEWGQHLTALRLDAEWLRKCSIDDTDEALARITAACARLQLDLQQQLRRLAPRDLQAPGDAHALQAALIDLVRAWDGSGSPALRVMLEWHDARSADQRDQALPAGRLLTLYRLSQEALTNTVRHAQARQARLLVRLDDTGVDWAVEDDGIGLPDATVAMRRGSGLAQLRERAWTEGADLEFGLGAGGRGLRLSARFQSLELALTRATAVSPLREGRGL